MKSWLGKSNIEMYSAQNERKSVVVERFIETSKNKIYKYMTSVSKNVYIDKLDDIVDKYNNTYHSTIKMKLVNVKSNAYNDSIKEMNEKYLKFKIGGHVGISKYKHAFVKGYTPNWSEETFVIKKVKRTVPWTHVSNDLNVEEIVRVIYQTKLQKIIKKEFIIENVMQRKGENWKGNNDSFISLIN